MYPLVQNNAYFMHNEIQDLKEEIYLKNHIAIT